MKGFDFFGLKVVWEEYFWAQRPGTVSAWSADQEFTLSASQNLISFMGFMSLDLLTTP